MKQRGVLLIILLLSLATLLLTPLLITGNIITEEGDTINGVLTTDDQQIGDDQLSITDYNPKTLTTKGGQIIFQGTGFKTPIGANIDGVLIAEPAIVGINEEGNVYLNIGANSPKGTYNIKLVTLEQESETITVTVQEETTKNIQGIKIGLCNTTTTEQTFNNIYLDYETTKNIISNNNCNEHYIYTTTKEGSIQTLQEKKEDIPTEKRVKGTITGYNGIYEYQQKDSITAAYYEITPEETTLLQSKTSYEELDNYLQKELPNKKSSIQTWNIKDTTNAKSVYGSLYATTILPEWKENTTYYKATKKEISTKNNENTIILTVTTQYTMKEQKIAVYAKRIYYYNKIEQEGFTKNIPDYTFKSDGTEHYALNIKNYVKDYNKEKNYGIEPTNNDNKQGQYIKGTYNKEDGSITFKATTGYQGTKQFKLYQQERTTKTYSNQFNIIMQSTTSNTPKLTRTINNINIPKGKSTTLNLETYFTNPEQGTLTYTTKGNKAVKISITGNTATLSIGTEYQGTERISITATNNKGSTTSNTFLVTQGTETTLPGMTSNQGTINNKQTTGTTNNLFNTEKPLQLSTTTWLWITGIIILILLTIILGLYLKGKQQQTTKKITQNNTSTQKINDYLNGLRETIN